jgi:L-ascorbate metabolism protein UlaG (beta-lactamase superfamily)
MNYWLRPNVIVEPLIGNWYAWSYLVGPATASLYVINQLRIMESFIKNPKLHLAASRNPALRGGSFLDFDGEVGYIEALVVKTKEEMGDLLELAAAIHSLDELLRTSADGASMERLYSQVPGILRGYVELVYDLQSHPTFRILERLLFKSKFYQESLQSVLLSVQRDPDRRAFVLSTPRVPGDLSVLAKVPFRSSFWDRLFRMRTAPESGDTVETMLRSFSSSKMLEGRWLQSFFTTSAPASSGHHDQRGDAIRIRYFGHATVLIEAEGVSILIDPAIAYANPDGLERFSFGDLPQVIDYVLLTHNHQDHVLFESLLQLRYKIRTIVVPKSCGGALQDPSLKIILQTLGFADVVELDELERLDVKGGNVVGLPFIGEHGDLNIRSKLGYLVELRDTKIMLVADSNNLEPAMYEHLHKIIGDVDVMFIGMECSGAPVSWMYGPLFTRPLKRSMDQSRRLNGSNFDSAKMMVDRFCPRWVNIYAMGAEPWLKYISSIEYHAQSLPIVESDRLIESCRLREIECRRLFGCDSMLIRRKVSAVGGTNE